MITPMGLIGLLSIAAFLGAFVFVLRRLGAAEVAYFIIGGAIVAVISAVTGAVLAL
ncbi:MAG: hypothetical protein HKN14_11815 [Marinicaulis sp.]|nr:hypothetical protein [Marinicaulis sp.]NNE41589.1 hypothetical protein [Marinicaulis sp.]NNL89357.1 hypothetical protein [Marinicaulis sp.]